MDTLDIYDEHKLSRQLQMQKRLAWDMEKRIPWSLGIDLSAPLLPLGSCSAILPNASEDQILVLSQLIGLIVAATISQLEQVAYDLQGPTWEAVLNRYPVNPEMYELGAQFFKEEQKHSVVFNRYIAMFADAVNVDADDFKKFLPKADRTLTKKAYALNSAAGGMSMWWLIAAVEEESLAIFRQMQPHQTALDPLYYQIHRAHFEEELRHKSYATLMLNLFDEFSGVTSRVLFQKIDFMLAECLNLTWTLSQLVKVGGFRKYRGHHPFFKTLESLLDVAGNRSPVQLLHNLHAQTPFISSHLHLGAHKHMKTLVNRFGGIQMPLTSRILPCT
jgi:P-aminobenzoate N-oxygenase AurF